MSDKKAATTMDDTSYTTEIMLQCANRYFERCTEKCFVAAEPTYCYKSYNKPLSYYLERHRDDGLCYSLSTWALMGLKDSDLLLRGYVSRREQFLFHGWVEFGFLGQTWVFDNLLDGVMLKEEYYDKFSPQVKEQYTHSKREVLQKYLTDKYLEGKKEQEIKLAYIPGNRRNSDLIGSPLSESKFKLSPNGREVEKFTAYNAPIEGRCYE